MSSILENLVSYMKQISNDHVVIFSRGSYFRCKTGGHADLLYKTRLSNEFPKVFLHVNCSSMNMYIFRESKKLHLSYPKCKTIEEKENIFVRHKNNCLTVFHIGNNSECLTDI